MSDYYTQTCFEIPNVSPMEAAWLKAVLSDLVGIFDDGDYPEDRDEETQALWAEVKECGYLALPYTLYDEPRRVLTVVGEDISVDALNIVLKAFLKRWNRIDTVEYTWSRRSDYSEEVGEFYGGTESVTAVETPRTRVEILDEIEALFREEFGHVHGSFTTETGYCVEHGTCGMFVTGPGFGTQTLSAVPLEHSAVWMPMLLKLWSGLAVEAAAGRVRDKGSAEIAQQTLDALRAKKAGG